MANKSKSNILSPIPSTDQERTLTFWHSAAARTHASSTWTSHNSLSRPWIWNGQCFGTRRRNQPLGQSKGVTPGLSQRTAEDCLQRLNPAKPPLLELPLSLFPECPAWFCLQLVLSPEQSTVLKTSVWGSAWFRSLGGLSFDLELYRYYSFWYQDTAHKAAQKFTGSCCLEGCC